MSTETTEIKKKTKGRLSWVVPLSELILMIVYCIVAFGGIYNAFLDMDFSGMFESVFTAIIILVVGILIVTVMCFIPIFRSKFTILCGIWNIIVIAVTVYWLVA